MNTAIANKVVTPIDKLRAQHVAAAEAKEKAWQRVTEAEARSGVLNRDQSSSDLSVRLAARVELPKAEQTLNELLLAAASADEAEAAAGAAVKEARRVELFEKKKQVIPRLAKCLLMARVEADALAAIEEAEQNEVGPVADHLIWAPLQSRTPTFEPLLDTWIETCRQYGLIE